MQNLKKRLNSILLIDDDEVTNFYNSHIISKMGISEHVHAELNGQEALRYLHEKQSFKGDYIKPDLIFLDVNMPIMNGFEFLEQYENLPEEDRGQHLIVMLTSSLLESDRNRASNFNTLSAYYSKPLSQQAIEDIIQKYFPEYMGN
jgi:CheY-like chemotaxis protein